MQSSSSPRDGAEGAKPGVTRTDYAGIGIGMPSGSNPNRNASNLGQSRPVSMMHSQPDPNALESLDDLIRREHEQLRSVSASRRLSGFSEDEPWQQRLAPSQLRDDDHPASLSSSAATVKPAGSATPTASRFTVPAAGNGASPLSPDHPRDESRWNGWHLWRMESYNRRVSEQVQAQEDVERAQRWRQPFQQLRSFVKNNIFKQGQQRSRQNSQENEQQEEQQEYIRTFSPPDGALSRISERPSRVSTRPSRLSARPSRVSMRPGTQGEQADDQDEMIDGPYSPNEYDKEVEQLQIPSMSLYRQILLTLVMAGVQVAWCLEFGYGTPYLLSIGLSKSATSLVWFAAPVSGLVVQPLIGVLSDMSTSSYRRRKYILGSACIVCMSAFVLAFSGPFASALTDILHAGLADWDPARARARDDTNRFLAVTAFVTLDMSINGVQAAARALILDVTPSERLASVNAWSGRMMQIGSIIGYGAGWYNLSSAKWLDWVGGGQFRKYSLVSLAFVAASSIITCLAVQEGGNISDIENVEEDEQDAEEGETNLPTASVARTMPTRSMQAGQASSGSMSDAVFQVWQSIRRLPRAVRRVCIVQVFAHMGWFPFLVYATEWVIETAQESDSRDGDDFTSAISDEQEELGSFALLMFASMCLVAGTFLPFLALSHQPDKSIRLEGPEYRRDTLVGIDKPRKTWRLTMRAIWGLSLVLYGTLATVGTFFVRSTNHAIVIVALIGVPWAVAVWVPYALVMESVREAEDGSSPHEFEADWFAPERVRSRRRESTSHRRSASAGGNDSRERAARALRDCGPLGKPSDSNGDVQPRVTSSILARGGEIVGGGAEQSRRASLINDRNISASSSDTYMQTRPAQDAHRVSSGINDESVGGTVLGIHNMSVVLPQLLTALIAAALLRDRPEQTLRSIEFAPDRSLEILGASKGIGVVWIMRIGGLASFVAAALTRLVPLTRTERMVLASIEGKPVSANGTVTGPRFDDEASDDEQDD